MLRTDEEKVWLLYSGQLSVYNIRKKKLLKTMNLDSREPFQPMLVEDRLWFVSQKNGLLYGVQVD